jgi:2-dehydro-3-deoxyphosphogluconate aldolase/(4S)-4-hydroxy-2-oxoglutarate aldolase
VSPLPAPRATAAETLERLRAARAIAVVRARDGAEAVAVADALAAGGLAAIELTFTTPGVAEALPEVRARLGERLLLGAGTITAAEHVRAAAEAGADFLVSPHLDPALLDEMLTSGLLAVPGVMTPSEVAAALRHGASVVKLFPASTVGVSHLKALLGPFPGLKVVPTGGISISSAGEWLAAGAVAVGLGGELLPKRLRDAGAWGEISDNAARLLAELREGVS